MSVVDVLIARETEEEMARQNAAGTQSILMVGKKGSGTGRLAMNLATQILGLESREQLVKYPYFYHLQVDEDKKEIPIEQIRRVVAATSLKIPSARDGIKRVVLIENAEKLSMEAQNALLKNLEEPSTATCYILTQDAGSRLLPTVVSRCQKIIIKNPSKEAILAHYTPGYVLAEVESAWSLSGGAPELMDELLRRETHPLRLAADEAKKFVAGDKYTKLLIVGKLANEKQDVYYFLDALEKIVGHLMNSASRAGDKEKIFSGGKMSQTVGEARKMLNASANTKLVLLWLATNF